MSAEAVKKAIAYMARYLKRPAPKTRREAIDLGYLYYLDQNGKANLRLGFEGWPGKLNYKQWQAVMKRLQRLK